MNSEEFIEEYPVISKKLAVRLCKKHDVDEETLFMYLGDKDEYKSEDVVQRLLGY